MATTAHVRDGPGYLDPHRSRRGRRILRYLRGRTYPTAKVCVERWEIVMCLIVAPTVAAENTMTGRTGGASFLGTASKVSGLLPQNRPITPTPPSDSTGRTVGRITRPCRSSCRTAPALHRAHRNGQKKGPRVGEPGVPHLGRHATSPELPQGTRPQQLPKGRDPRPAQYTCYLFVFPAKSRERTFGSAPWRFRARDPRHPPLSPAPRASPGTRSPPPGRHAAAIRSLRHR